VSELRAAVTEPDPAPRGARRGRRRHRAWARSTVR
jgi:hypothetical protein